MKRNYFNNLRNVSQVINQSEENTSSQFLTIGWIVGFLIGWKK